MMNDYAMYDLAQQRYADLCRAVQGSRRRPLESPPKRGRQRLAAVARALVSRTAAWGLRSRQVVP